MFVLKLVKGMPKREVGFQFKNLYIKEIAYLTSSLFGIIKAVLYSSLVKLCTKQPPNLEKVVNSCIYGQVVLSN